jgi:UDP-N-acetylmuramoyl-tripeptide--D-alanyl-D-alanine ligase
VLPADGLAVLNADDGWVAAMAARTEARVVTFGRSAGADVRALEVHLDGGRARFTLATPEGSAPVHLRLYGEHHVSNALAAACVAREFGMTADQIARALSEAGPRSRWRMEVTERSDGVTVVNDAYNANPESMRAALEALVGLAAGRRTWAVLGEMRELGEAADEEHEALGRLVARMGVSRLVAVGPGAVGVHAGARLEGSDEEPVFVPDPHSAIDLLRRETRPGDVVLVKASRAVGLEAVADALVTGDERSEEAL